MRLSLMFTNNQFIFKIVIGSKIYRMLYFLRENNKLKFHMESKPKQHDNIRWDNKLNPYRLL